MVQGYRYDEQHRPPEPRRVSEVVVERFEDIFEVDPALMTVHVAQQFFPNWDTLRIASSRQDHLDWMHRHWAGKVVSGQRILRELDDE